MDIPFIDVVLIVGIIYLIIRVGKLEGRIKGMKYSLDQLANKIEVAENPIDDDLRKLLKEGKDVQAVKVAREMLGLSLVEAKQYVDDLTYDGK
ncbi:hypothetical protein [Terrihalobacillus insolitus]|uniref:hypothetical protein n=1 Tax=Terrihalobacillus insolitus TaxID=2950438 RepID=UPI00233FD2C3|nr:hypothetical protein [Terrihalobacillus insolitus]MDC3414752.1 hypothetical protein [Terrihalobacillus insolitus]